MLDHLSSPGFLDGTQTSLYSATFFSIVGPSEPPTPPAPSAGGATVPGHQPPWARAQDAAHARSPTTTIDEIPRMVLDIQPMPACVREGPLAGTGQVAEEYSPGR